MEYLDSDLCMNTMTEAYKNLQVSIHLCTSTHLAPHGGVTLTSLGYDLLLQWCPNHFS